MYLLTEFLLEMKRAILNLTSMYNILIICYSLMSEITTNIRENLSLENENDEI